MGKYFCSENMHLTVLSGLILKKDKTTVLLTVIVDFKQNVAILSWTKFKVNNDMIMFMPKPDDKIPETEIISNWWNRMRLWKQRTQANIVRKAKKLP